MVTKLLLSRKRFRSLPSAIETAVGDPLKAGYNCGCFAANATAVP